MNIAIITGASSGMGRECVRQVDKIFDKGIDEIWVVARRKDKLEQLKSELSHEIKLFPLDLTDERSLAELELSLNLVNPNVKLLINAAGYGIVGPFDASDEKEQSGMVRLNCETLLRVTRMTLDYMKKGARIIQFASSAAFLPQPDFSVYAASKSFVLSFSRSLNAELKKRGISVTAVCPGPVNTEFFSIAEKNGSNFNFKKYFMADEKKVVECALYDAYRRKEMSVYSVWMQLFAVLTKLVPHKLILFFLDVLGNAIK